MGKENNLQGLTSKEVKDRVEKGWVNTQEKSASRTTKDILIENIFTLFNLLNLLIAIALAFVHAWSNLLFMAIIIMNVLIGIIQELKAKKMVDDLSILVTPKAMVLRDGRVQEIIADEIVLDDIMVLKQGQQISCDASLVEGSLEVNESLLTGESDAIQKEIGDEVLSGSYVVAGQAYVKVNHVGEDNYANKLADQASTWKPVNSQLLNSMKKVTRFTCFLIIPLGILLFIEAFFMRDEGLYQSVVSSSAALLGMLPKGLVLLMSISLAAGIVRLGKKKILVQRLYALETLSHVDVLCLDKTGTLTTGKMKVDHVVELNTVSKEDADHIASYLHHSTDSNATFEAMAQYFKAEDIYTPTKKIPFSSERKWSAISFDGVTYVVGAPERLCQRVPDQAQQEMKKGNRVIVIGKTTEKVSVDQNLPKIDALYLVVIQDVLRENCQDTIQRFHKEGVQIKIISGDHVDAVSALAKQAGVIDAHKVVDLSQYDDTADYGKLAEENVVFGRVSPQQKKWLVKGLQSRSHRVAMTGDGVNDILALREADCSIAIAQGNDAVKQISEIVLLDSSFKNLSDVLFEGRRVVNNITRVAGVFFIKTIYSVLLSVICVLSILGGADFSFGFPFIPIQITLIDAAIEAWPSFVTMMEPNHHPVPKDFLPVVLKKALPFALMILVYICGIHFFTEETINTQTIMYYGIVYISMLAVVKSCIPMNPLRLFVSSTMVIGFTFGVLIFKNLFHLAFTGWFVIGMMILYLVIILLLAKVKTKSNS